MDSVKTLKILGIDFKINFIEDNSRTDLCMGRVDIKTATINISKIMPKDSQRAIILHEVIHVIDDMLALDLSEQQVTCIAAVLFATMEENNYYFQKV